MVRIRNLSVQFGSTVVLSNISFSVEHGHTAFVLGSNGAGKSTLLRCMAGLEKHYVGKIEIQGTDIKRCTSLERARLIAYVPQIQAFAIPFTVQEFVAMGRFAHQSFFPKTKKNDKAVIADALELTATASLIDRTINTLSGGELQRVFIAAAVAQQAPLLLLDEPAAFLDPYHSHLVYQSLERIRTEVNVTTLIVTHDLNVLQRQREIVVALRAGKVDFFGSYTEFAAQADQILARIYGISFITCSNRETGTIVYTVAD
ncbi:MAG: ABC transporter ATP-binding protein [Chitinivibrionales bacterium]|nr:ABC transporter ATP-binding protein [Chitinivibrionales bacterium]